MKIYATPETKFVAVSPVDVLTSSPGLELEAFDVMDDNTIDRVMW